jgi:hypothetical protein
MPQNQLRLTIIPMSDCPESAVACTRREKFFPEEDAKLKELVRLHGQNSWSEIANEMPGRNARQCRERWKHYLSSEKNRLVWTAEEDQLLFQKMTEYGPRWTALSRFFPGRSDLQIKHRWMQKFARFSDLHLSNRTPQTQMPMTAGMTFVPAFQFPLLPFPHL